MATQWYLLAVQPKREKSAQVAINNLIAANGLEDEITDVVVPTHTQSGGRGGKQQSSEVVSFPGYVMIQMEMTDDLQRMVRDIPNVGFFVSDNPDPADNQRKLPLPMSDWDVARFVGRADAYIESEIQPGDMVTITEGSFKEMNAIVQSHDPASGRIIVNLHVFGRETPVEMASNQVLLLN